MRLAIPLVVFALAGGAVVLVVSKTGRSPTGCRVKSVDEAEYVAGNRAILDELPVYPGATRTHTLSIPQPASDKCVPTENGPPYDAYATYDYYTLPPEGRGLVSAPWKVPDKFGNTRVPARVPSALVYYDSKLRERGWKRSNWSGCCEIVFRRGRALLGVTVGLNPNDPYKRPPSHQFVVDHAAY